MCLLWIAASIASQAQTFTTLVEFDGLNGSEPSGALVQGLDGNIYGTAPFGGNVSNLGYGTVFKMTPQGTLTVLKVLTGSPAEDGSPATGLVQTPEGSFYGTTNGSIYSTAGQDAVFWMNPEGRMVFVVPLSGAGGSPMGLVLASDGNLYGTTEGAPGAGTVFKATPEGSLTILHDFCSQIYCTDGYLPAANLVQAADGNFYGTTVVGGENRTQCNDLGCGTVFRITPEGTLTTLYSFCTLANCADGTNPQVALVQSLEGSFYGATGGGGANCATNGCGGTIFKITASGTLTTVYSFCAQTNCSDGASPSALILGSDGNLYGTTPPDGTANGGVLPSTIFKVTPQGVFTTLHHFCALPMCTDGWGPSNAGLVQATNGVFYGTTVGGGSGHGTIYSLDVGLGPFVETLPTSGKVGKTIDILSQGLTGTTAVSFNGVAADFTVVSDTYLTATIPAGATTGFVSVTTPTGTLKSNGKFRVTP